jgi:hypothetical protein
MASFAGGDKDFGDFRSTSTESANAWRPRSEFAAGVAHDAPSLCAYVCLLGTRRSSRLDPFAKPRAIAAISPFLPLYRDRRRRNPPKAARQRKKRLGLERQSMAHSASKSGAFGEPDRLLKHLSQRS